MGIQIGRLSPVASDATLWLAFGLGLAVAAGNGLARFSDALLLPAMRDDLDWTYAKTGLAQRHQCAGLHHWCNCRLSFAPPPPSGAASSK